MSSLDQDITDLKNKKNNKKNNKKSLNNLYTMKEQGCIGKI